MANKSNSIPGQINILMDTSNYNRQTICFTLGKETIVNLLQLLTKDKTISIKQYIVYCIPYFLCLYQLLVSSVVEQLQYGCCYKPS